MRLRSTPLRLLLKETFTISRGSSAYRDNLVVTLEHQGMKGLGEAAPYPYYGESPSTAAEALRRVSDMLSRLEVGPEELFIKIEELIPKAPSVRAALDMAVHDLMGKREHLPLHRQLGLDPADAPLTSFTIGLDSPERMLEKVEAAGDYPILKVKAGGPEDEAVWREIRRRCSAALRVDANAAWDVREAVRKILVLKELDVEFVEQPIEPGNLDGLRAIKEETGFPVMLDEDVLIPDHIPPVAGLAYGVNVKLMKCGGIRGALEMVSLTRAHGLKVMLGCMIESSLAITAAAQISPLADYADLDGNLLISNDPFVGVETRRGRLMLPEGPGLGVRRAVEPSSPLSP